MNTELLKTMITAFLVVGALSEFSSSTTLINISVSWIDNLVITCTICIFNVFRKSVEAVWNER